ncbi:MAG: LysR family transcriptional regulator, partial [Pseudomonadota bacterium]
MKEFDYDLFGALVAVAQEGSFELAAKALRLSQPAVSLRLKQLEERIGTPLIVRGRPCFPTETGLRLIEHYEQISLLQRELSDELEDDIAMSGRAASTVRVSVSNDSLATWFPEVIKRAKDELSIRLSIVADDHDHTETWLKSGNATAVVTSVETEAAGH